MPSSAPVNDFNRIMQTNGVKDGWLRSQGIDPSKPVKLSDAQRQAFRRYLESQGASFPSGIEIDAAGNMNENEGFGTQLKKWGPLAAGIAVTMFGIPGTPIAGLLSGGGSAAAGAGAAKAVPSGFGLTGIGGGTGLIAPTVTSAAAGSLGGTLLRYGLQYGVPVAGSLIAGKMAANAERDSNAALMGYYDKALDAEKEERDYRRGFDEENRDYTRSFNEEGRRYGRYSDSYKRDSDEEILRYARTKDEYARLSDEEILGYGRAADEYGRLSDEEKLLYGRAEDIRDKNYGYQQYGNFVETLEPFRASGAAATSRMSGLLGGPTPADTGSYLNLANTARAAVREVPSVPDRPTWNYTADRPTWNYTADRPTWNYPDGDGMGTDPQSPAPPVSTTQPVDGGGQVLMRAPDGTTQAVSPDQVAYYEQRGAVRA